MFPHNSSSHEISTETNAFVQNSKGDVVVLEGSSLSGVGEGTGPEDAGYCDIEYINSSSTMAAPTSHPEATAANDFSTVLSRHSGELGSAGIGEARQSLVPATTKNPTNHLLTYGNNDKRNNHNNAEHNHHKYRKQNTPGALGQLGSSADNSKSTCKRLSDNKNSFSHVSIRVLSVSLYLKVRRGEVCRPVGVPSLVRIPKSDCPQRLPRLAASADNYSLLGSRLDLGGNNNLKANLSFVSNNNNNSKSVILLSSTSYGDHCLLISAGGGWVPSGPVAVGACSLSADGGAAAAVGSKLNISGAKPLLLQLYAQYVSAQSASSSITLIVSKKHENIDHAPLTIILENLIARDGAAALGPPLRHVAMTGLAQHICVPLSVECKSYDNDGNKYYCNDGPDGADATGEPRDGHDDDDKMPIPRRQRSRRIAGRVDGDAAINVRNNNPDVIKDTVNVAVCYKTSCITTTNVRTLGSQNDGISCTEATICTVGALSFQDNNKSNEPLNTSFKIDKYRVSAKVDQESNFTIKSVSKSTLSVKSSDKSEMSHAAWLDKSQNKERARSAVNIPTLTTCEPTMTLRCQSTTVTSQTNDVPVSRVGNRSYDADKDDGDIRDDSAVGGRRLPGVAVMSSTISNDSKFNDDGATTETINQDCNDVWTLVEPRRASLIAYIRTLVAAYQKAHQADEGDCDTERQRLKDALNTLFSRPFDTCNKILEPILDYKKRWGIPAALSLIGGGESSLNSSGATNWSSGQATTPNNNNASQSGWGGTPGNPSGNSGGPPGNWSGSNVNRSVTSNPNQNQNQGPPGAQNNPGNANKVNNPNQSTNAQSGPPTVQPNNSAQVNQNNGQWSQGKTNNPGVSGPNPSAQNNNSNNVPQQPPAGPSANNNQIANPAPGSGSAVVTPTNNTSTTKQQLEQLNTMRDALFSQDGWGCQHVNQDTNWDIPTSPEPAATKDGVTAWKPPVNNGTDLWEVNLRNGGQPPPAQQTKTPWGHTPSTNIGGTWGEDDETSDSSSMWAGAPAPNQQNNPQWPGGTGNQTAGSNWGDPRVDPRDHREIRSVDPREMRDPRDHRMSLDPREHIRVMDPMVRGDPRMNEMRGDPRGISGRLNGASADAMWGQSQGPPHHQMPSHQHPAGPPAKMLAPSSMNQWPAQPPKDMMQGAGKPSGWEEPSPPTQRRNMPNYDDGTSLWGNVSSNQRPMPGAKVSHWKELPVQNLGRGELDRRKVIYKGVNDQRERIFDEVLERRQSIYNGVLEQSGRIFEEERSKKYYSRDRRKNPNKGDVKRNEKVVNGDVPRKIVTNGDVSRKDILVNGDLPRNEQVVNEDLPQKENLVNGVPKYESFYNEVEKQLESIIDEGMQCPPGMPQNRMPVQPGMKPDVGGPMWTHPSGPTGRNGSWVDGHEPAGWDDPKPPSTWNEPQLNPASWAGPGGHKPKPMGPSGSWADSDMEPASSGWSRPSKPPLTKELIWNSREFRWLCDQGFKKEDVEIALRSRQMNREEAQELLSQLRPVDQWRRHDTHSGYDPNNQSAGAPAFPRFNHVSQEMSFPPVVSRTPQSQPSTQQLRMLVQQIQLAVQEGYLNHQILNQPLAPQTLILLNQLLQQIKVLQQLHQQHTVQSNLKGNNQTMLQISVQITKTKQQIANLQNQIAVQQATYMKQQQQQQQQQQHPTTPSQPSDYYKSSVHDPMSALQNSFGELSMNKEPPVSQQQSRLNQWKLPSIDKDGDSTVNDFSRAPGSTSIKPAAPGGLSQSHSSPNINPLLGPGDGTWSSRLGDSGWPDPGNSDSTDGKDWQPGGGAAFTDLVPEFEPGKPWKGNQMKSIEDDPSITPGSVVRSPLSLAAIKDPDTIFSTSSKTSPPPQVANADTSIPSLSNSTWSFNPPTAAPSVFASAKNTWGDTAHPPTAVTSELWGAPMIKSRGPPPGLGSKGSGGGGGGGVGGGGGGGSMSTASNGWGLGAVSRSASSWGSLQTGGSTGVNTGWMSTWLLLRNLTPQIDGSTLKTLCMQHGPVQDFRLYLNHGIALTKYSSRDEAIKAQGALNNCVLGNTTIFAESPADSEVHTLLQQLSHGGQQQTSGNGGSGWGLRQTNKAGPPLSDTWSGGSSQLWGAPPGGNSLWSNASTIDSGEQQRATPCSLNSYLPGDLLGGESM